MVVRRRSEVVQCKCGCDSFQLQAASNECHSELGPASGQPGGDSYYWLADIIILEVYK